MPRGSYLVGGIVERFACGPGPAGWRYVGTRPDGRVDLVLDARGAVVRLEVVQGRAALRGGAVGEEVLWTRGDREHVARAAGFTGSSPAFLVATGRRLQLAAGGSARVRLVEVTDGTLGTREVDQDWTRVGGQVEVRALDTGAVQRVRLDGDVVRAADGVELLELDGAPTLDRADTEL